jgi:acyl-CoA reductase-like NAD-dependent aldehyde dehydrogenase
MSERAELLRAAGFAVGPPPTGRADRDSYTLFVPIGVVGLHSQVHVIPALAAGNAVILAGYDTTLAERLDATELPAGVFTLLPELPDGLDLVRERGETVTLTGVTDEDEAIRTAGAAERVAIYSDDVALARRVAHALAAEHVWINAPAAEVPDPLERYVRPLTVYAP